MNKTVLKRVKAGSFCTVIPDVIKALPPFLAAEREELECEVAVLEEQTNVVRRNEHLRLLVDKYLPDLWRFVHILKMELKYAAPDDEKARDLLVSLGVYVPKRTNLDATLFWIDWVLGCATPDDTVCAAIYEQLRNHVREMHAIDALRVAEARRISSVGRCKETRSRIMAILQRIYEIAKGFRHIAEHKAEAERVLEALDTASAILKRHMPRGKRKKGKEVVKENEDGTDTPHVASLHTGLPMESPRCGGMLWGEGVRGGVETQNFASLQVGGLCVS